MGDKTTGEHTGITISAEDDYGDKVTKGVPLVGGLYTAGQSLISGDTMTAAASTASFVQTCTDAIQTAGTDPLGLLVSNGLNFLLAVFQPLQEALHWVTGDGPALANAAGNFANIGKGLATLGEDIPNDARKKLDQWKGDASTAAHDRLDEFSDGVRNVAALSGDIAALLEISGRFMVVIEEVIKAFISELAVWMLEIWIPALAASGPTCGGSVAQAGTFTTLKANQTVIRTGDRVNRAGLLKDMVGAAMEKAGGALVNQVKKPGNLVKNVGSIAKAYKDDSIGQRPKVDVAETSEQLDF